MKIRQIIIVITVITVLVGGVSSWTNGQKQKIEVGIITPKVTSTQAYIQRGPITITSDSQLNNSGVTGFKGNGTIDDPILIEGYNITFSSGTLISISSTTFYFRIENNLLNGMNTSMFGISLSNTINGVIENNTVYNIGPNDIGNTGIHLGNSNNNIVTNNTVHNCGKGLALSSTSSNNSVSNNTINSNDGGILLGGTNNTISNNTIKNSKTIGIYTEINSNNHTITNNEIYNNFEFGMLIEQSSNNSIKYNFIHDNGMTGIKLLSSSNNNLLTKNTISTTKTDFTGIGLTNSNDNVIQDNIIFQNQLPLDNGQKGVELSTASNNTIRNNTIYNIGFSAIHFGSTSNANNLISQNKLFDSKHGLVISVNSNNNNISENEIYNNEYGFVIEGNNNNVSENMIYDNNICFLYGSNNSLTKNILFNNNNPNDPAGIRIEAGANGNNLTMNDFFQNAQSGSQVIDDGTNTGFNNNHWSDWTGTGSYTINGSAGNEDTSPLINPYHLSESIITAPTAVNLTLAGNESIQWNTSSDTVSHSLTYSVFYSTNDGTSWTTLASGLTTTNYTLDTMLIADGPVIFKVQTTDSIGFIAKTTTEETFLIANDQLSTPTIISPNGNETLNETITIEWNASLDSLNHHITYTIYYSTDNGATWTQITTGLNATSYSWDTTTVSNSFSYLIKIVATCSGGKTAEDISDGLFTIQNHQLSTPTIISPNGGETLNETITIEWNDSLDSLNHSVTYTVYYSTDNGATWTQIATGLTIINYSWDTTAVSNGFSYLIKVVANCSEGETAEDLSDGLFTVQNVIPTTTDTLVTTTSTTVSTTATTTPGMMSIVALLAMGTLIIPRKKRKK